MFPQSEACGPRALSSEKVGLGMSLTADRVDELMSEGYRVDNTCGIAQVAEQRRTSDALEQIVTALNRIAWVMEYNHRETYG